MNTPFSNHSPYHRSATDWNPSHRAAGIEEKGAALLAAPVGQAFIVIAAATGLAPREIAAPATSIYLAAQAADDVELYHIEDAREEELCFLRREVPKHSRLAREILAYPDTAWWFSPMDTENQIWVSEDRNPPSEQPGEPAWIHSDIRQDMWAFVTSTYIEDTASMLAAVDLQICDVGYGYGNGYAGPPYAVWGMKAAPEARVFEVDSPHAWHELCMKYTRRMRFPLHDYDLLDLDTLDVHSYLEPDWAKVRKDWDAVHLTLGGLLTSHQVAVESDAGWTYQYGWDTEQTWWLRWVFSRYERLDDHTPTFQ